ncbi:MAG TPA: hypothetical protein VH143_04675 [Kofleriaceae bacterium]|nr:hypothetical protein [Kofleriaceae bacterium]
MDDAPSRFPPYSTVVEKRPHRVSARLDDAVAAVQASAAARYGAGSARAPIVRAGLRHRCSRRRQRVLHDAPVLGRTLHAIVDSVRSGDLVAQARFT